MSATGQPPPGAFIPGRQPPPSSRRDPAAPRYIVTRADGVPIDPEEPCFVIRGQDAFALRAIQDYIALTLDVVSADVTGELILHRERIRRWQQANPGRIKLPDTPEESAAAVQAEAEARWSAREGADD